MTPTYGSVQFCTVADIVDAPRFAVLHEEYADECALEGLPRPKPNVPLYKAMEANGALHALVAYYDDLMVGFAALAHSPNPHYGLDMCVVESIFLGAEHRSGGMGDAMLAMLKSKVMQLKAPGMLLTAPAKSQFAKLLDARTEYALTNLTYLWLAP